MDVANHQSKMMMLVEVFKETLRDNSLIFQLDSTIHRRNGLGSIGMSNVKNWIMFIFSNLAS